MASSPIISWQIDGGKVETVADFIFLGSEITAGGDYSHEIKTLAPRKKCYHKPRQCIKKCRHHFLKIELLSVQLFSRVWLFVTPWTAAHQASLSFTISQSLLKLMSVESVMPSNHLILCHPLLLLSIFPSIRVFSN